MPWSRELDPTVSPNPFRLDDNTPSYDVRIRHILPAILPIGVGQFWQVVDCAILIIDKDCKVTIQTKHFIDVVFISGRSKIEDTLTFSRDADACFVLELCTHTVGFDNPASFLNPQTSVVVAKRTADHLKAKMIKPIETFSTSYLFNRSADCCADLKSLLFFGIPLPLGERLAIGGIGTFDPVRGLIPDASTPDEANPDESTPDEEPDDGQQFVVAGNPNLESISAADLERFHVALSLSAAESGMHARYLGGLPASIGLGPRPVSRPGRWLIERAAPSRDADGLETLADPVLEVTVPESGLEVEGELVLELGDRTMILRPVGPGGNDVREVLATFGERAVSLPDRLRARLR